MSDAEGHLKGWEKGAWMPFAAALPLMFYDPQIAVFIPLGYAFELFIDPDLDQIGISRSESRMIKTIVLIPFVAWTTLYARIMQALGGHRNRWSHSFTGTVIRFCWMLFPFVVLFWRLGFIPSRYTAKPFLGLLIGLVIADAIHYHLDGLKMPFGKERHIPKSRGGH